jgi:hypothetical protein
MTSEKGPSPQQFCLPARATALPWYLEQWVLRPQICISVVPHGTGSRLFDCSARFKYVMHAHLPGGLMRLIIVPR